jgi:hypothetical protein
LLKIFLHFISSCSEGGSKPAIKIYSAAAEVEVEAHPRADHQH